MSISLLNIVHTGLKKVSESNISKLVSETSDTTLNKVTRTILNTSIHIVEKSLVSKYISEFYGKDITSDELSKYTEAYYKEIKNKTSNYLDIMYNGGGAFIILLNNASPSAKDIACIKKVVLGTPATEYEWVNNISPFIPKNGFEVFKRSFIGATNSLMSKYEDTKFNYFLTSSKDVGHAPESSNINFFMGSIITSIINTSLPTRGVSSKARTSREFILENEAIIYKEFNALMKGSKANKKKLFDYFLSTQLTYLRQLDKNGIHAELVLDFDNPNLASITKDISKSILSTVTSVAAQDSRINQDIGRSVEALVSKYLHRFYEASHNTMKDAFINKFTNNRDTLVNLKGSKSIKELVKDTLIEIISTGKPLSKSIKTTSSKKSPIPKIVGKAKPKSLAMNTNQAIHKSNLPQLRNLKGHFTSPTNIMALMNQMLHDTIQKNMQRPNLRYQTGRFAKSVKVEGISRSRDGALTAFLSYMRYPYATFEAGGKQGHKGYYPSRLINESAREIAAKLTRERFTSVTIK